MKNLQRDRRFPLVFFDHFAGVLTITFFIENPEFTTSNDSWDGSCHGSSGNCVFKVN